MFIGQRGIDLVTELLHEAHLARQRRRNRQMLAAPGAAKVSPSECRILVISLAISSSRSLSSFSLASGSAFAPFNLFHQEVHRH